MSRNAVEIENLSKTFISVKRKAIVGPKPAFALRSPTVMGIVEQEQKGVIAPNPAPAK